MSGILCGGVPVGTQAIAVKGGRSPSSRLPSPQDRGSLLAETFNIIGIIGPSTFNDINDLDFQGRGSRHQTQHLVVALHYL